MDLTGIVLAAVGGGGLGWMGNYFLGKRKEDRSDFESVLKQWKELYEQEKQETTELKIQIDRLQEQVKRSAREMMLWDSVLRLLPFPMWIKDTSGVMLVLNDAYEKAFLRSQGLSRFDYIQRKDIDVWGEEIGEHYWANDRAALESDEGWFIGNETIIIPGLMPETSDWLVAKVRLEIGGEPIAVLGMCLPWLGRPGEN